MQKKWRKHGDFTSERRIAEVLRREGMDLALESIWESYLLLLYF